MNIYTPNYYSMFSCIAAKCQHNCCVGWEIGIDEKSLEIYKNIGGMFGKRLCDNIDFENQHFILTKDERCPFLDENNLCDIIKNIGEDKLCQICSDHPRFRNFFDRRIETGLGLCCEEAGRIILTAEHKMELLRIQDGGEESEEEKIFFDFRSQLFNILQNRLTTVDERILEVLKTYNLKFTEKTISEWIPIYLSLECMDSEWQEKLKNANTQNTEFSELEIPFENLIIYFLYRHLSEGLYDGRIRERILFAFLSYYMIKSLIRTNDISELIEISRMYSAEIEYSEENIDIILKELQ